MVAAMHSIPNPLVASAVAVLLVAPSCGSLGGSAGPTADVRGNIEAVEPDTDRDIVVFVYHVNEELPDCSEPELPENDDGWQSQTLSDGETEFEIRNNQAGRFIIAFLLDDPGNDADGRIDPGDPVAVLDDPDCILDDVPNKYIVQADDIRINFTDDDEPGFPDPGRAEADDLSEAPE